MMKSWKLGSIIGGIWGVTSIITLSGGMWLNPLIRYTFGLPTTLSFFISNWLIPITITIGIGVSYIILLLLAPIIGALIGTGVGYLVDKYKRVL